MAVTGLRRSTINQFEDYIIVEGGIVYHMRFDVPPWGVVQVLTTRIDRAGYLTVRLNRNGKSYTKLLHRLLAEHFIPNPLNLPEVDHVNGDKLNITLTNLRWCTHAQNTKYAHELGLMKKTGKKVIDTSTGNVYNSAKEAALAHGLPYSTCKGYLNGTRPNPTSLQYIP